LFQLHPLSSQGLSTQVFRQCNAHVFYKSPVNPNVYVGH